MNANIALLEEETWQYLRAALRNGLGLTAACQGLQLDIQAMSQFLRKSPDTLAKLQRQVATGYSEQINMLAQAQNKGKAAPWRSARANLDHVFVAQLTLWEEHCTAGEATDSNTVAAAFALYRHQYEVATACGLTRRELVLRLQTDVALAIYLTQAGYTIA